ncbi:hypothetical protein DYB25_011073 [Aphanomyces astaci]|uniref:Uncharacterized protein n=1 Tax=Aphanomyces astaci TaxID=112090 RepID=A0A397A7G8_APHAT|nr:hypothetical protein DYB25_011073 [Aphanomyces astaci]RHY74281.1 hypothetical protein DYB38_013307 [Aphanomyces astaci]RHZ03914.1 hypothetical protein DYB31_003915 [Aphanomyces astaci]RHZ41422.1 hypothetical protein DYB26_002541 [Aphanomyces astaci]
MLGNCGSIAQRSDEEIEAIIKAVPQEDRMTLRSLEYHSGIPNTPIMWHMAATKKPKACSSHVKPFLTGINKTERLWFAMNWVKMETLL